MADAASGGDAARAAESRVAVVTGASRGIGRAAALALARDGFHVVAVARTRGGLEELDDEIRTAGGSATLAVASVTDYGALDRLGAALFERWGRLDALVANAGALGVLSPVSHIRPSDFAEVFNVNVTANYRLIRSLQPLLRQSAAGRAVFVTTSSLSRPFWGAYKASKAALDQLVRCWAEEMKATPIRINLLDPGPVRTVMRAKAMPGEDPATVIPPEPVAALIARMCAPEWTRHGEVVSFIEETTAA